MYSLDFQSSQVWLTHCRIFSCRSTTLGCFFTLFGLASFFPILFMKLWNSGRGLNYHYSNYAVSLIPSPCLVLRLPRNGRPVEVGFTSPLVLKQGEEGKLARDVDLPPGGLNSDLAGWILLHQKSWHALVGARTDPQNWLFYLISVLKASNFWGQESGLRSDIKPPICWMQSTYLLPIFLLRGLQT